MKNALMNLTLGVLVAIVGVIGFGIWYGWHNTTPNLGRDFTCESPYLVNRFRLEPCGNYALYVQETGDWPGPGKDQ